MARYTIVLLLLAALTLPAQDPDARRKFAGTWEARWKDMVICTIRLKPGPPLSGETEACTIHVDDDGNLQEPEVMDHPGAPATILNIKLSGDTLTFEEKDGDDVMKFEFRLVGDGKAELRFPEAPVRINPIPFVRQ
jgi:hypothetical protein